MLHFGIPYAHAKLMTDYQINSLVEWHHNVHHSAQGKQTVVPDVDHFSNLAPILIAAHLEQTKRDLKIIAKIKRTKRKGITIGDVPLGAGNDALISVGDAIASGFRQGLRNAYERIVAEEARKAKAGGVLRHWPKVKRKIRSRGFDKTKRRTMRGKVVPR